MSKILVFGHKNPDTDTICSALAMADLKTKMGMDVEPVRLGEVNGETAYVLDYFGQVAPRLIGDVASEGKQVILVDHNEFGQSADGIENVEIIEVVDHHRIANFETAGPLYYRAEPVGCTATILTKMYRENEIEISKEIAGILVSAIISDTLLFKSPTCTDQDVKIGNELAAIAGIDINEYGLAQLKAGASIAGKSPAELIQIDSKPFTMGSMSVEVAQISVVDVEEALAMKADLLTAMADFMEKNSRDSYLVLITDILTNDSIGLVAGESNYIETAFGKSFVDGIIDLPGVVSRKKQVVPQMTDAAVK